MRKLGPADAAVVRGGGGDAPPGAGGIPWFRSWLWLLLWAMLTSTVEPSQRAVGGAGSGLDLQQPRKQSSAAAAAAGGESFPARLEKKGLPISQQHATASGDAARNERASPDGIFRQGDDPAATSSSSGGGGGSRPTSAPRRSPSSSTTSDCDSGARP
ncbi:unnamed protein product, partial [Scytosiphon promiscuus]